MDHAAQPQKTIADIVPEREALGRALALLAEDAAIAVPTETVYGLTANAKSDAAVAAIYTAKGRPSSNPLIIHVSDLAMAETYGMFSPLARSLAEAFWPGPLTLVVPKVPKSGLAHAIFAGHSTVAIRQPKGFMAELIEAFGAPLAAPSANLSGQITGTDAQAVWEQLGGRIPLIIDGGRTEVGLESTILQVIDGDVLLLREGGLAREAIEQFLDQAIQAKTSGEILLAPGMMQSHYAPNAPVYLNANHVPPHAALLNFGNQAIEGAAHCAAQFDLSPTSNFEEAAHHLFAALRLLDAQAPAIYVAPIPQKELGAAINDRLKRAAAERPNHAG